MDSPAPDKKTLGVATCASVTSVLEGGLETAHWGLLAFCTVKIASSKVSEKPCLERMRQRDREVLMLSYGLFRVRYIYTHVYKHTTLHTTHEHIL